MISWKEWSELWNEIPEANPDWSGDKPDPATSYAPYKIYNIGNNNPVELLHFIKHNRRRSGKKSHKEYDADAAWGCAGNLRRC